MQHITPNMKNVIIQTYAGVVPENIKSPAHMAEGEHRLRKSTQAGLT